MAEAGYSGTPLAKKLGLKDGQAIGFVGLPEELEFLKGAAAFASVADIDAQGLGETRQAFDFLHVFSASRGDLEANREALAAAIRREGMIWISWPKRASKVPTDVTEDVLREVFLPIGLVDVKVCAVDETWSGLKFVIRKELR